MPSVVLSTAFLPASGRDWLPERKTRTTGTISVLALRALCVAMSRADVAPEPLLGELNVDAALLEQSDARIPAAVFFRALEGAIARTGDSCFCLHAADRIPLGTLEVVDFAMKSSPTIGEALSRAARYAALVDDACEIRLAISSSVVRLVARRTASPSPRAATELLFALLLARGRELTGRPWPLREVSFLQEAPEDAEAYERFFGVPVRFSQERSQMTFDVSWLGVPCLSQDNALARFFDRHATGLLERLPGPPTFLDDVKRAIAESLRDPRLEVTAKRLVIGPRTLQRRLEEHGTSHKELVEEVRRELALDLVGDSTLALGEIAHHLGFFDASTFHRAFKRWTAMTPAEHRRSRVYPDRRASAIRSRSAVVVGPGAGA
jgi:AraC-like DNA-binding protein